MGELRTRLTNENLVECKKGVRPGVILSVVGQADILPRQRNGREGHRHGVDILFFLHMHPADKQERQ
jgi:hypothetical protein